jgi:hypothetical protein
MGVVINVYIRNREQIYFVGSQQYHVIDLQKKCLRTSFKDPDLLGPLCKDFPWVKVEDFIPDRVKYLGTIHLKWNKMEFTPTQ